MILGREVYQRITMTSIWNRVHEWARALVYTWSWYEILERNEYSVSIHYTSSRKLF